MPTGKGGNDLRKEKGEALKILGRKRGKIGKALKGRGQRILRRNRKKISAGKGRRGERGERISTGKGGERSQ